MERTLASISPADLYARLGTAAAPCRRGRSASGGVYEGGSSSSHLPIHAHPDDVEKWRKDLPSGRRVVVHCVHGHEVSQGVAAALRAAGVDAAYLAGRHRRLDRAGLPDAPSNRRAPGKWVTRERPKIDRIACPWLISRFIDPRGGIHLRPDRARARRSPRRRAERRTTSRASNSPTRASDARSIRSCASTASTIRRSIISPRSCAAPTPRGTTSPRNAAACSRSRSAFRRTFPTITKCSKHGMVMYDALYTWCRKPAGRDAQLARRRASETGATWLSLQSPRPTGRSPSTECRCARHSGSGCASRCLSFGGPAGQIAVMHRILVEEKRWISESRFLHALNYCMLLPGPEAQQLATYIGWLMHRTLGGIMAGGLFVIPGIIAIMALSYVYAACGNVPVVVALFFGLKAAVLAIVLEAVVRIGKRSLKNNAMIAAGGGRIRRHLLFRCAVSDHHLRRRPDRLPRRADRRRRSSRSRADTAAASRTRPWSKACSATSCPTMRGRPLRGRYGRRAYGWCFGSFR